MDWPTTVAEQLDLQGWSDAEQQVILDLARDVAHGTERYHAPLTSYALGLAVGAATATATGVAPAADREDRLRALAETLAAALEDGA